MTEYTYVICGKPRVKIKWKKESFIPEISRVTSVHGFCFNNEKLLMIRKGKEI